MVQTRATESANNETYITREEMLEFLRKNYLTTDPLRIQWEAMTGEDQDVMLRKAYHLINSLPYIGRPADINQAGAFPRAGATSEKSLLKVKYAQAEQALALSDTVTAQEIDERKRLRRAGVVQYSIGDLSETFQSGAAAASCGNLYGLSENAYKYLSQWLQGGFNICTSIKRHCGHL